MTDDSSPQRPSNQNQLGCFLLFVVGLIVMIFGYAELERTGNLPRFVDWLGLEDKSFWDLLDLALVPLIVAIAGGLAASSLLNVESQRQANEDRREKVRLEREKDLEEQRQQREALEARRRDEERYREETVRKYFDDMVYLMLSKDLMDLVESIPHERQGNNQTANMPSPPEQNAHLIDAFLKNPVWRVAQTRTITVLRRMAYIPVGEQASSTDESDFTVDVQRANEIIDFLRDSGLLTGSVSIFCKANLRNIYLDKVNLAFSNMYGADLTNASMSKTLLIRANLSGTTLISTNLQEAVLQWSDLSTSFVWNTNFKGANLNDASLVATIWGTDKCDSETLLPDSKIIDLDENGFAIFDKYYDPDRGPEQMDLYTKGRWQPDWFKRQSNNNDEDS